MFLSSFRKLLQKFDAGLRNEKNKYYVTSKRLDFTAYSEKIIKTKIKFKSFCIQRCMFESAKE